MEAARGNACLGLAADATKAVARADRARGIQCRQLGGSAYGWRLGMCAASRRQCGVQDGWAQAPPACTPTPAPAPEHIHGETAKSRSRRGLRGRGRVRTGMQGAQGGAGGGCWRPGQPGADATAQESVAMQSFRPGEGGGVDKSEKTWDYYNGTSNCLRNHMGCAAVWLAGCRRWVPLALDSCPVRTSASLRPQSQQPTARPPSASTRTWTHLHTPPVTLSRCRPPPPGRPPTFLYSICSARLALSKAPLQMYSLLHLQQ